METGRFIKVGDDFDLFRERQETFTDGAYLEAVEDNAGFYMSILLNDMNATEKKLLKSEIIRARMFREGNKIIFIIRYGVSPLMFEASFDPTLYDDKRAMQITFDNHILTVVGVERSNNTIQTLRQANFPMKLKQALITAWTSAFEEEDYSINYTKWLNSIYHQYSVAELWDIAEDVGHFGEKEFSF